MRRIVVFILFWATQIVYTQQVKFFHTFGNGIFDSGEGVVVSPDSGYVVAGITNQGGIDGNNVMIYKTDSLGVLQWFKHIGETGIEGARSIVRGLNNEYVLAGFQNNFDTSGYNCFLVKTDLNGDTIWTRTFGGGDWDMAYSVDVLADSTYVVAGETYSFGSGDRDMYVVRVAQNGDTIWTRTFGGSGDDYARYVYVERHNNILVIGSTNSYGAGGSDLYIVYMDVNGDTIWTKAYGSVVDEFGYSGDMYIDNSNKMSFAFGYTTLSLPQSVQEAHILRADSVSCTYINDVGILTQPTNPEIIDHHRVRMDGRGRFYYCAERRYVPDENPDIYLHRTLYGMNFGYAENAIVYPEGDFPKDIRKSFDKGYVITGETTSWGPGLSSSFLLRVDSMLAGPSSVLVSVEDEIDNGFSVYPVPVINNEIYIDAYHPIQHIRIFDLSGKMILSTVGSNYVSQMIQFNPIPSGVYIIEIETYRGLGRKKLLVQ